VFLMTFLIRRLTLEAWEELVLDIGEGFVDRVYVCSAEAYADLQYARKGKCKNTRVRLQESGGKILDQARFFR
jgi:hypothetical protein